MTTYKIDFWFYKVLNRTMKTKIDSKQIEGQSVLACARKAFEYKQELEKKRNCEIVYKKNSVEKIRKRSVRKEERIDIDDRSMDLSAKDAIDFINNNTIEFLEKSEFISEEEDRITVMNAFNKKQKQKEKNDA